MDSFPTSLQPLAGGHSGETFLADAAGEQVVVRVYGGRSARRGPLAPEIDAAVLELVRGLLPVPAVLEVRRGDPDKDLPGLLVTGRLPGERLDLRLPVLDDEQRAAVGARLGTLVGRLGHMVQARAGLFTDRTLVPQELAPHLRELPAWLRWHRDTIGAELADQLAAVVEDAQDLLDTERRTCLVHGDLNAKNLLVDPATLEVTGVLDWEFAHAGSPYADLGNLLRSERDPTFTGAVLAGYRGFMPGTPDDLLDRARAADLFALMDRAALGEENDVVDAARALLSAVAATGSLHAEVPNS
jgi:aminoglycoside phosphotransferase (APT) family kinase protein